jgi:hypothetical protein
MTAQEDAEMQDDSHASNGGDDKKQKRCKPRRQSGTAVAMQKRDAIRKAPERTTSSHLTERKGKSDLEALGALKPDRRGSQGAIKAATSALRAARGVPASRGVSRAASSQQAPERTGGRKKAPTRSSSTKQARAEDTPTLTGADLLHLRKATRADDNTDDASVQSDLESTYTLDSIYLRKSQIHHNDDEGESTGIITVVAKRLHPIYTIIMCIDILICHSRFVLFRRKLNKTNRPCQGYAGCRIGG